MDKAFASTTVPLLLGNVSDIDSDADLALVVPSKPALVDITSHPVSSVMAGAQYLIAINATNHDEVRDWASVVIVEVRDSSGITGWLNWHSQIIAANSTTGMGMSWMPDRPDDYEIRTFVISSLANPRVFSPVEVTKVAVH